MPDYNSAYTGQQIDAVIGEATSAGAITARLSGNGEPTNETVARVGDLYTDISDDGKMYHCISASSGVYEWEIVGSGEGGTPDMSVDRITGGVRITVTDTRGTTQADLLDGVSPTANVTPTVDGAEVEITDRDGTTTATLSNGYHIGSVALTSGGTGSGQTATYTMYLNDDEDDPTAAGTFSVYNGADGSGAGDMTKAVYDTNNNGKVDNAENADKLGDNLPSYYAAAGDIPTAVSELTNDANYITDADVPTTVSELENDAGYITENDIADIVPAWALETTKPTYTASEVGALAVDATAADSNKLGGTAAAQYAKLTDIEGKQDAPTKKTALPASGTALDNNAYYIVIANVGTYQFVAPSTWAHGFFTTASSPNITFDADATFIGGVPEFTASTQYEFDVYLDTWAFAEVVS